MDKLALIACGSAAGGVARFLLTGAVHRLVDTDFPLGTLVVNVLGCLLIGGLGAVFAGPHLVPEAYRFALAIGVLGGFTTFSSYSLETLNLLNDGQFARAAANVLLSNGLGLVAVWLGYRVVQRWVGA